MAEQVFEVKCGFFDAVDEDRVYYADDMNLPYKRLISNGVFATPQGTPGTDLQAVANSGMVINVLPGNAIFADKWFMNEDAIAITVPSNAASVPRLDSVVAQVDTRVSGRVGSIVYRTGTASSTPVAPSINTVSGVVEYRLANVLVNPSVSNIYQSNIYDCRGSDECPWVTSLVQQVDTSTLFAQWQSAYELYYNEASADFGAFLVQVESAWNDFISGLTDELTVATNVITIRNSYTTAGNTTLVPVGIPSYNSTTDVLLVYINGLLADSTKYTYLSNNQIRLNSPLTGGQLVNFVCFKSVITGNISSVGTLIAQLNQRVSEISNDSGWIPLTMSGGASAYNESNIPAIRCIGDRVYLRGAFKGVTTWNTTVAAIPVAFRPEHRHIYTTTAISGSSCIVINLQITPQGEIKTLAFADAIPDAAMIPLDTEYSI